ncbi:MAG: Stk1 family PASTA domain-containing Ser/Thr kinase [Oscillospiraceae bacterium]|nr:Stk1 family PASTA domain-containing Ser/Thr kinase [Oscillospiraceae bacterium]
MDKNIGKKLDGRYEITELIGVGGMADVYKGVDIIDNKQVAIKILKKEYAENEEFLRRFRNESKAIAVLSHPNIVRIYDVGFSEKIQYIIMEYIDGITLKEYIEEEQVLTWKDTVHFIIQILRALQHAHDKGIVHRDIKPQNIMMFTDGTIKVMDFGIAKFARDEGKTATDQAIGSVHYISPEQAKGDVTDAKSDIYSVGAMMYEMLTGKKPFDSDNPVSIAVMHMHDIPVRPRTINPEIPCGLEEIVLRAMEKDPADRYQSTTEMIADIDAFKENPEITFGYYSENGDDGDNTKFFDAVSDGQSDENHEYSSEEGEPSAADMLYGGEKAQYAPAYDDDEADYDDDDDEEEEERSSLVVPVLTAAVVVVIIVAVIFVASLVKGFITGDDRKGDFKMPDFHGIDYNTAVSEYGNNIKFQIKEEIYSADVDSGCIIDQDIEPGTAFKKGDVLNVTVSRGMETVVIPSNLANMNAELARAQLKELGLNCELKNYSSSEVEEGNVIKTEPEMGSEVAKNSTIILYVSMGVDREQFELEDFTGKTIDEATTVAEYMGLIVLEPEVGPSYEEEGIVFGQSIEPGTTVETGTEIRFQVSSGVLPEGEIPMKITFPANAYGRFVIDYFVTNEDGSRNTVTSQIFMPQVDSSVSTLIAGAGQKVTVKAVLSNLNNNKSCTIGEYVLNFADNNVKTLSEDINGAFLSVDGIYVEPTEAPTEPPTQAPPQPTNPPAPVTDPPTQPPTQAPTEAQTPSQNPVVTLPNHDQDNEAA